MRMQFKIDCHTVTNFLELIKTDEYPINITPEGWKINYPDRVDHMFMSGILKSTSFMDYPKVEKEFVIIIPDNDFLKSYLSRFSGILQITYQDGQLLLATEEKGGHFRLGYVTDQEKEEINERAQKKVNLTYENTMNIHANMFKNSSKDATILKREKFKLVVKDNIFSIYVGTDEHQLIEKRRVEYPDTSCLFGPLLKEVFQTLEGEVEIGLRTDAPIRIVKKDKSYIFTYIIAPMDEESEGSKKEEEKSGEGE